MEAIASCDEVAGERAGLAASPDVQERPLRFDIRQTDVLGTEDQMRRRLTSDIDQIADDLVLPVDRDRPAAREPGEIDPMPPAAEGHEDALVPHAFAAESRAEPDFVEQIDRCLLEDAGAHAIEHMALAADLDRDRVDPRSLQQVSQQQTRWSGADDADGHAPRHTRSF